MDVNADVNCEFEFLNFLLRYQKHGLDLKFSLPNNSLILALFHGVSQEKNIAWH